MWTVPFDITAALCAVCGDASWPRPRVFGSLLTDSLGPLLLVVADVQPFGTGTLPSLVVATSLPCPDHGAGAMGQEAQETVHHCGF